MYKILIAAIAMTLCLMATAYAQPLEQDEQAAFRTDINSIALNGTVKIAALGEASHGTSEFQTLKGDVFKALLKNNGCLVFAIEGDFGGAAKVNEYIHGGAGTAEEAIAEIGFKIYNTREMADIVEWMREYNATAAIGNDIKFYGFDSQRWDNNKELLFEYLKNMPELAEEYAPKLAALTDGAMYSLDEAVLAQAEKDIAALMTAMINMNTEKESAAAANMNAEEAAVIGRNAQIEYDLALQYAQSVLENTILQSAGADYGVKRDEFMAQKVRWIEEHEDGLIFINGHNGHIGKQTIMTYTGMGQMLYEHYGEAYFAIGTEALRTRFNALDGDVYREFIVENKNAFSDKLIGLKENMYYLDFAAASKDASWKKILEERQSMTSLGATFSGMMKALKTFYTLSVMPGEAYDGIIVFRDTRVTEFVAQ